MSDWIVIALLATPVVGFLVVSVWALWPHSGYDYDGPF